ncbi:uroporphyrinogen-III synthase [Flavobacterium supellecticarium]|uniref:Uroporphyrinogen-III synthase n=1 Tax=Flavobacterium supellecticarium TaxID=2565924 RepID=A0A4S3ZUU6_9FLAO|nr:uroporphyrinogen-III synthase [Flavobacterium supellecticarium]THF49516.1 uroporphyrinogen-III synthase [Flavobacterium supellecticarium]
MPEPIRILSTKKLLSNQKQYLLNAGFAVVESDFIKTEDLAFSMPTLHDFLLFTSQNAVHSVLKHADLTTLQHKNVFCVGLKTKALLEANGFTVITCTGYAAELADYITEHHPQASFTFFNGNLRRDTLPDALHQAGITFNEVTVYATVLTPHPIQTKAVGILFFSPSGVESYVQENSITDEICFCIGTTTAEALENRSQNVIIANQPTIENTIIQCLNYFKSVQS